MGSICADVAVQERDHVCAHASPWTLRGREKVKGWLLIAFSLRTVKLRAQNLGLSPPPPTALQAMCEGCSVISTCWPERCIWPLVKSAQAV